MVDGVSGDVYQPKKSPLMSSTSPFYVPALSWWLPLRYAQIKTVNLFVMQELETVVAWWMNCAYEYGIV